MPVDILEEENSDVRIEEWFMDTVYVYTLMELKTAINQKKERIIVRGNLAKKLEPLTKITGKPNIHEGMSATQVASALSVVAVPAAVWITLIITTGVVVIVGLLLGYNAKVKVKGSELIFDKK